MRHGDVLIGNIDVDAIQMSERSGWPGSERGDEHLQLDHFEDCGCRRTDGVLVQGRGAGDARAASGGSRGGGEGTLGGRQREVARHK